MQPTDISFLFYDLSLFALGIYLIVVAILSLKNRKLVSPFTFSFRKTMANVLTPQQMKKMISRQERSYRPLSIFYLLLGSLAVFASVLGFLDYFFLGFPYKLLDPVLQHSIQMAAAKNRYTAAYKSVSKLPRRFSPMLALPLLAMTN